MKIAPVFLLIEPSPILRSVLRKWLEYALKNPRLLTASSGDEALQLATQEVPSYVLMEMDLPDKQGIERLRELRQALPAARIIATSWYASSWLRNRVESAGADGLVSKDKLYSELLPLWLINGSQDR